MPPDAARFAVACHQLAENGTLRKTAGINHKHIARLRQIDCRVKHQIVALRQTHRKRRAQQPPTPDGRKRAVDRRAASHHVDKI